MARQFLTAIDLAKNELQNGRIQNLASAPASPVSGQIYYNTTDNKLYWYNGTIWVAAEGGTVAYGAVVPETTFGQASSNGSATTLSRSDHTHGSPTHTAADHASIPLSSLAPPTADVPLGGFKLTGVGTPTAPTDAANKGYVDGAVAGLAWKDAVRVASTANVVLTGLTAIDGVTPVAGDRILLKNQTAPAENGIWVAASGAWARATDADLPAEIEGAAVFVTEGTTNADTAWVMTTNAPITIGTTGLTWIQFAGTGGSVPPIRQVVAGAGLTGGGALSGDVTLNVANADGSLTIAADTVSVAFAGFGSAFTAARSDHTHANYARSFTTGCAAALTTTVNHNLGNQYAHVQVTRTASPWDIVECDVEHPTVGSVLVRFATAPAANEFTIQVIG